MKLASKTPRTESGFATRLTSASAAAESPLLAAVREVVTRLSAESGGLAALHDEAARTLTAVGPEVVPPWRGEPSLLEAVRRATCAVRHQDDAGHWLLAPVWTPQLLEPWLLWARRESAWSDAEVEDITAAAARLGYRLPEWRAEETDVARRTALMDQAAWMAGRLAHDFGNVLTGILGFTELTVAQLAPNSPLHRYMTEVWQAARAGAGWVHQLQMFGRRSVAGQPSASVAQAAELARQAAWPNGRLHVALPKRLPPVAIDADALKLALTQLLHNAREACINGEGSEGAATLAARTVVLDELECLRWLGLPRPGAAVEVAVTDTGPGIAAAAKNKLFRELFFSSKPRHRGLGLAVVYGIVRAHRGGLRLEDNAPRGAVARIVLPVVAMSNPGNPAAASAARPTAEALSEALSETNAAR
jgi:signal transduction histidine kinase